MFKSMKAAQRERITVASSLNEINTNQLDTGNIGWRNRFLRIDSWAPSTFTNSGSGFWTDI
jgi:hypothetical protein